jgi:hypothetical protein
MRDIPTYILENWWAAYNWTGGLRYYYGGETYTIQQVRQELAERRKNDT